jgi:hypothetical protein
MWDRYYTIRIFLVVQKIRFSGWWRGLPSLRQYSWRQIACGLVAAKIRRDRNNGIEPSLADIKLLRDLEKEYNVHPSKI